VWSLALVSTRAEAQRWREIGTTSDGNKVYVNPATIVRTDSVVSATVRVVYTTPEGDAEGADHGVARGGDVPVPGAAGGR
jgi:hypothetical protein